MMRGNNSNIIPQDRVKDVLITKTAIKTLKPNALVEKIINFQFKDAIKATRIHNEVEISGFGKFFLSQAKIKKKIRIMNRGIEKLDAKLLLELPSKQREFTENRRKMMVDVLSYLKTKQK